MVAGVKAVGAAKKKNSAPPLRAICQQYKNDWDVIFLFTFFRDAANLYHIEILIFACAFSIRPRYVFDHIFVFTFANWERDSVGKASNPASVHEIA